MCINEFHLRLIPFIRADPILGFQVIDEIILQGEEQEAIEQVEEAFAFLDDPLDGVIEVNFEVDFEPLVPIEEIAAPGLRRHRSLSDVRPEEPVGLRRSASWPYLLLD